MALTENATRIYLGTNMGDVATQVDNFEQFNSRWCAKMIMLSVSKIKEDKKTYEAMKAVKAYEFYIDAITH